MTDKPTFSEQEERLITGLVDGSLNDAGREAAEAWMRERPDVQSAVAEQRRAVVALRGSGPPVPGALVAGVRRRVQEAYEPAGAWRGASSAGQARGLRGLRGLRGPRGPRGLRGLRDPRDPRDPRDLSGLRDLRDPRGPRGLRGPSGRGLAIVASATALAAAVLVAVALSLGAGGAGDGATVVHAAQLAYAPATEPAPAVRDARFLDVSYGGVTFPNYERQFGVVPSGERVDRLDGRRTLTVFYRLRNGAQLSYTVFSGTPVSSPRANRTVVVRGVRISAFLTHKLSAVTLVRFGRTCVLAAPTTEDLVLALAAAPLRAQLS